MEAEHVLVHTGQHPSALPRRGPPTLAPHRLQALLHGSIIGNTISVDGQEYPVSVWPLAPTGSLRVGCMTQISYSRTATGLSLYRAPPAPSSFEYDAPYLHPHEEGVTAAIRGFLRLFPGWDGCVDNASFTASSSSYPVSSLLLTCGKGTGVRSLLHGVVQALRPEAELIVINLGKVRACGRRRSGLLLRQLLAQSCLHAPRGAVVYLDCLESALLGEGPDATMDEGSGGEGLLEALEDFVAAQGGRGVQSGAHWPVVLVGRVLGLGGLQRRQLGLWHQTLIVPPPSLDARLSAVHALLGRTAALDDAGRAFAEGLALSLSGLPLAEAVRCAGAALRCWDAASCAHAVVAQCIGHEGAKQKLDEMLLLPRRCGPLLARLGLAPELGALLYGPPGTGKTLLVRRLLQLHAGYRFIELRLVDVIRGEVGAGEKAVVAAFAEAKRVAPALLFIDEFQALFVSRADDSQDRGFQSLSSALAGCFDDLCVWNGHAGSGSLVTVVAATNEPWSVDRGFLRPGRFDRLIYVGPLQPEERCAFFAQAVALEETAIEALVASTEGYSGADLELVLLNAHKIAEEGQRAVALADLQQALLRSVPTSSAAELRDFRNWEAEASRRSLV